jgi:pSer/pThr/pTyr-binding forkhead associated (FHA) protein
VSGAAAQIGRARDNEVRVADWFVEPYQAQILRESGRFRLINLSAETPVFRNEEPVEDVLLEDGDVIQMGMSQIAFAVQDEAAREVETQKTASEPEEPRVAATEFRAYGADSREPTPEPTPFDAEAAAELDQAIDQVLDEAALHSEAPEEEPDQIASARTEQPSVEPWDRWAEELAELEPAPDNAPETTPETAETDLQSIKEETSAAEEFPEMSPAASSSPEEQAFADLEGLVESDEEYRPTPANENWNAPLSEEDAEFLASAFAPSKPPPDPDRTRTRTRAHTRTGICGGRTIEESAHVASTPQLVEEPARKKPGINRGRRPRGNRGRIPARNPANRPRAKRWFRPPMWTRPRWLSGEGVAQSQSGVVKQAREQLNRLTGRDYDL